MKGGENLENKLNFALPPFLQTQLAKCVSDELDESPAHASAFAVDSLCSGSWTRITRYFGTHLFFFYPPRTGLLKIRLFVQFCSQNLLLLR